MMSSERLRFLQNYRKRRGFVVCVLLVLMSMTIYLWDQEGVGKLLPVVSLQRLLTSMVDLRFFDHGLCSVSPPVKGTLQNPETKTDRKDWSFTNQVRCPAFSLDHRKKRRKVSLDCQAQSPKLVWSWTESSSDIFHIPFGDPCLVAVIDRCCKDKKPVPNVVHYVWYADKDMPFIWLLNVFSVVRFMRPCLILLHGPYTPFGPYWDYIVSLAPNIIHVNRTLITTMYGQKLAYPEHGSDVMRIEALQVYGGLYLDYDTVLLKPVDQLRDYNCTTGLESPGNVGNQFLMAEKNAAFLDKWHEGYRHYSSAWTHNSLIVPYRLSLQFPLLVHVDGFNFCKPNWGQRNQIYNENYNWSTNYAMHMYVRHYGRTVDPDIIRTMNTTVGSVSRHILLGNKELCAAHTQHNGLRGLGQTVPPKGENRTN